MGGAEVILLNGSFGVGKTTVARRLRSMLAGSVIYDPEWAGWVLQRLAVVLPLCGSGSDDFQDLSLWRRSVVHGTRLARGVASRAVLVPMTFDDPAYFDEIWHALRAAVPAARAFCLTASLPTIRQRLSARGTDPDGAWIVRRTRRCVRAHVGDRFGERVDTEGRDAHEVATDILHRLGEPAPPRGR